MRVWNIVSGECVHTLTGHTSLVGLLGLSPSHLVSAAADSTLRVWDPDSGELRYTLASHTGAITCFQHDEFKVLSGSDGNLKMWNIRDGSIVRDLLTGITGVWQVVFEGRWCVAASNRNDTTVLDVWDFATENDDDEWVGEPPSGIYDEDIFSDNENDPDGPSPKRRRVIEEEEDQDQDQVDADAMDQDLMHSEPESVMETDDRGRVHRSHFKFNIRNHEADITDEATPPQWPAGGVDPAAMEQLLRSLGTNPTGFGSGPDDDTVGSLPPPVAVASTSTRHLPNNDETPTRPRRLPHTTRRR